MAADDDHQVQDVGIACKSAKKDKEKKSKPLPNVSDNPNPSGGEMIRPSNAVLETYSPSWSGHFLIFLQVNSSLVLDQRRKVRAGSGFRRSPTRGQAMTLRKFY
jgi:hypothetical protein